MQLRKRSAEKVAIGYRATCITLACRFDQAVFDKIQSMARESNVSAAEQVRRLVAVGIAEPQP